MIRSIYQTPRSSRLPVGPEDAAEFIGSTARHLPELGSTFDRYGLTWSVLAACTIADPRFTFRCLAQPLPLITDHSALSP